MSRSTEIQLHDLRIGEQDSTKVGPFQLVHECLGGGLSRGVERLVVESSRSKVSILPTRGMSLHEVWCDGCRFGWQSPICGPVHPSLVPMSDPSGLGWLDGFDELLVRCGLTSNGAPDFDSEGKLLHPLHGKIANLPATSCEIRLLSDEVLEVVGVVQERRFHFDKWQLEVSYLIHNGGRRIDVIDRVTNMSGTSRDFQLLYHFNLGQPLLESGSKIVVSANRVVPRDALSAERIDAWSQVGPPTPGDRETVYFCEPAVDRGGCSTAMLTNHSANRCAAIRFDVGELPCFSIWKNEVAERDGYVIGLEPATNFPNRRSFEAEKGRTVWLDAGHSKRFRLELRFGTEDSEVAAMSRELLANVQLADCRLDRNPHPEWCAT